MVIFHSYVTVYQRVHPVIQWSIWRLEGAHPVIHDLISAEVLSCPSVGSWSEEMLWAVTSGKAGLEASQTSTKLKGLRRFHNQKFWLKLWIFIQKNQKFWIVLEDPFWHFGTSVLRQTGKVRATIDQTSWLRPGNNSSRATLDEADLYWCPCIPL